ncbi:MAG: beta-lactamase family protein, partial [Bacteroidota bacterium]|nr:beta-lactamase family protein [Bacteroidota bacterium]MDX5429878.1 beta-lactamase family protein [Bacteroidota bacterium]MDX5468655.1 beta-lactamase family protein [Bacteroidota bacterium]
CLFHTMPRVFALLLLLIFVVSSKSGGDEGMTLHPLQQHLEAKKKWEAHQIDSFITKLSAQGLFNGTLLVARGGEIIYHESMGVANRVTEEPITNDMPYQMASVSKPITAAAIMLLVQQGEIGLDDKITKYLPELPQYNKVKVRHLLTHTSGIPDYIYRYSSAWKQNAYMSNDGLLSFYALKKYRTMFTPGYRYEYCNTNYAFLASIIERVTEEKFADFVNDHIFQPLGMCHSHVFTPEVDSLNPPTIKGYRWTGRSWLEYGEDWRNGIVGDKGVFSTADDMLRFSKAFDADYLWCNETCDQIFKPTYTRGRGESEYGYGWRMRQWDSMDVVLHYGFWNSFRTGLIEFPESDVTFVILNNFTGASGGRVNNRDLIIRELMKIMFPKEMPVMQIADLQDSPDEGTESEGGGEAGEKSE